MSKAALDHFTRCTALDLGKKGVRVNSINPGFINTDFHGIDRETQGYSELLATIGQKYPLGRVGDVADCANAIAFFANEKPNFINGAFVTADGGFTLI